MSVSWLLEDKLRRGRIREVDVDWEHENSREFRYEECSGGERLVVTLLRAGEPSEKWLEPGQLVTGLPGCAVEGSRRERERTVENGRDVVITKNTRNLG